MLNWNDGYAGRVMLRGLLVSARHPKFVTIAKPPGA
jgi:hypothetical protein